MAPPRRRGALWAGRRDGEGVERRLLDSGVGLASSLRSMRVQPSECSSAGAGALGRWQVGVPPKYAGIWHYMSSWPKELGGRQAGVSTNSETPKAQKGIPVIPRAHIGHKATPERAGCVSEGPGWVRASTGAASRRVWCRQEGGVLCFGPVQVEDHFTGCYLWPDADGGIVRPHHVSLRQVF